MANFALKALLGGCSLVAASAAAAQAPPSTRDLDFFIGRWEGESTFLPAFTPGATPRRETIRAQCASVLAGAYVQCEIVLANMRGRERRVMFLLNYNEISGRHENLVLNSNYGQESSHALTRDAAEGAWVGLVPTTAADGRRATERIVYSVSPDGNTIRTQEFIRPDETPAAAWVRTYEATWRRIPSGN